MRRSMSLPLLAASLSLFTTTRHASAGLIADENAKAASSGSWPVTSDGTAFGAGVADVYPARWSIKQGDTLALKVRSTTAYDLRIFRLGYYGGGGQREIRVVSDRPPSPQLYPTADATYGMVAAKWTDSVTIATDATWTPGLYVARVEQPGGAQAETIFVVRDDGLPGKMPILFLLSTNTHQAYNAWPGPTRGGKSLYGFNSSDTHPTAALTGFTQAVKVSYDRPFFVGGGTADIGNNEYPFARWLEKNGWEVAYCLDADLHDDPTIALGRKVVMTSGHWEYVSRREYDALVAARDAGVNLLFATGDTLSWQVRFEDGTSTLVGYKESYAKDPEQKAGKAAKDAGDIASAKAHYAMVTRGWKTLEYDPTVGIDERRPGISLTGVQSSGVMRDPSGVPVDYPWGHFEVVYPSFFLFEGTDMKTGDRIADIMGYEIDTAASTSTEFDPWRPPGQTVLGRIVQASDGKVKGSASFYRATSGAEVVAMGAIAWSWSLDDFAQKTTGAPKSSEDTRAQRMMTNLFTRWTGDTPPPPPPPPDAGPMDGGDPTPIDPEDSGAPMGDSSEDARAPDIDATVGADASTATDAGGPSARPSTDTDAGGSSCSCTVPGKGDAGVDASALVAIAAFVAFVAVARVRAQRAARPDRR